MRLRRFFKEIILPAGLLSSMIVGAGMFALPYVFSKAGLIVGFLYLIVFVIVVEAIHRMYAEIIQHTEENHRFVGYARIYLGTWGFLISTVTTAFGILLTLTAYIIIAGNFLEIIYSGFSGIGSYIFWFLGSAGIVISLRRLANLEFAVVTAMGIIVVILLGFGLTSNSSTSFESYSLPFIFLPYGVVLFSLGGRAGISPIVEYFRRNKLDTKNLYRAISVGTVLPVIVYSIFIFAVLWLSPNGVSPDALSGLDNISSELLYLVVLLGLFALWTSYFFLGLEIRDIFRYDIKLSLVHSLIIVISAPILFFVLGFRNLIDVFALGGGLFLAMESIMVVAMYSKLKKWSFNGMLISTIFLVGALYEIYAFIL